MDSLSRHICQHSPDNRSIRRQPTLSVRGQLRQHEHRSLTTSFKDAGLGTGTTSIQITLSVKTATAVYQCFNNGGNHPKAGNKETVSTSLTKPGTFSVRNGQTTGSLTVGPPGPGSFTCPSGQTLFLQSATYSGISVSDATGNTLAATPDPISTGPIHVSV